MAKSSIPLTVVLAAILLLSVATAHSSPLEGSLIGCIGQPDGTPCDDASGCTSGETCRAGSCLAPASFTPAAGSPIAVGDGPHAVVARDLDGDGKVDLAVANTANSNNVSILLGNGSGAFTHAPVSPVAVGINPYAIAAEDLNGDGMADLAVANFSSDSVTILLRHSAGGYLQPGGDRSQSEMVPSRSRPVT